MMHWVFSVLLCLAACFAQTKEAPPQPPPDSDAALRARITEFFQYHVTGQFRKAEALVAEDSKDVFYNRNKPRYIKFLEIARIDYSENFTKALATVTVTSMEMIPGWTAGAPTIPVLSNWKLEDGQWYWYVPPDTVMRTPFGIIPMATADAAKEKNPGMFPVPPMAPATQSAAPSPPPQPLDPADAAAREAALEKARKMGLGPGSMVAPPAPPAPSSGGFPSDIDPRQLAALEGARKLGMSPAGIPGAVPPSALNKVKPDKLKVVLKPGESDTVTFKNSGADQRSLMMLGGVAGVEAKFNRVDLNGGEDAVLTFSASKDAKTGMLNIVVPQTGEMMVIQVVVK
jgi:hypothetical protein